MLLNSKDNFKVPRDYSDYHCGFLCRNTQIHASIRIFFSDSPRKYEMKTDAVLYPEISSTISHIHSIYVCADALYL